MSNTDWEIRQTDRIVHGMDKTLQKTTWKKLTKQTLQTVQTDKIGQADRWCVEWTNRYKAQTERKITKLHEQIQTKIRQADKNGAWNGQNVTKDKLKKIETKLHSKNWSKKKKNQTNKLRPTNIVYKTNPRSKSIGNKLKRMQSTNSFLRSSYLIRKLVKLAIPRCTSQTSQFSR